MSTVARQRRHKIAVITNGWSSEFLSVTLEGVRREARDDQSDLFIFVTFSLAGGSPGQSLHQLQLLNLIRPEEYDGILLFTNTFNTPEEHEHVKELIRNADIPVISTEVPVPGAGLVGTSNYQGVYDLACHLIEKHGVKSVVYVSGYEGNEESNIRRKALEDALSEHGLTLTDVMPGDFGYYRTSIEVTKWIQEKRPLPDAFVCANDHMAIAVISTLHRLGIDVPRDTLVTGFDQIHEAQVSYPLVATVARDWRQMGAMAYRELIRQIGHPDPEFHREFGSRFVPSESCGCKADEAAQDVRLEKMRNHYAEASETSMVDFFFQEIRVAMARVESKEQFHEHANSTLGKRDFFGKNYCICTETGIFDIEDDLELTNPTSYSEEMDVLFEQKAGISMPQRTFSTHELYPGYQREPGKSNVYVFSPMNTTDMLIGYLAIKNYPDIMYDVRFRHWINNLETLLITIRQYMFSQLANRKLRAIYMTDLLTGINNRTGCENVLYPFINEEKNAGRETVLLFVDINFMKMINDEYGHLAGDLAIKATAQALRNSVPEGWYFGRYGGDEFIAVGPIQPDQTLEGYRKRFSEELSTIRKRLKVEFPLSASLGYYIIRPDDEGQIESFIRKADESMYEEKERAHREMKRH